MSCKSVIDFLFSYETPKILNVHNRTIGVLSRIIQLTIIGYIIGYVLIYQKGYQDFSEVKSAVTTKLKGVALTNFSDEDFNPKIENPNIYKRIWDVADYVIPPSENGAAFVMTNVVITPNQTQSVCAEDITVKGANCSVENNCTEGVALPNGNGIMTGRCIPFLGNDFSCEVQAWCPVENDVLPLRNKSALLAASQNFTILIKNFVEFPKFKNSSRRNIKDTSNKEYLENCHYDANENPECPVFRLGDVVNWAGENYDYITYKGGVIAVVINWDCNLDWDKKYCFPTYSFSRLDNPEAKLAPGWNFRHANYYSDNSRTLYKLYGIKFVIIVQGQAGKFTIVPLLLNVGAGLGLLALNVVVCDVIILYVLKTKEYYKSKKYEEADAEKDDFIIVQPDKYPPSYVDSATILKPEVADGYQRLKD